MIRAELLIRYTNIHVAICIASSTSGVIIKYQYGSFIIFPSFIYYLFIDIIKIYTIVTIDQAQHVLLTLAGLLEPFDQWSYYLPH